MAVLGLLFLQNPGNSCKGFRAVHHAGGVYGVIKNHGLGAPIDLPFKVLQIRLEAGKQGVDLHAAGVPVADVAAVLAEIGAEHHHIVLHVQNGLEHDVDGAGSAVGHDDVIHAQGQAKPPVETVGHGLTNLGEACIVHVAVKRQGILGLNNVQQRLGKGLRHRGGRIAQREIVHIFRTHPGGQLLTLDKHLTDGRGIFQIIKHLLG